MIIHDTKPNTLKDRQAPDSVAMECRGCETTFLWERRLGLDVKCPHCKRVVTMETLDGKPVPPADQRVDADDAVALPGPQG